eukprot:scaffold86433_cov54-Phaeocystis_antarctica.AAC.1
MDVPDRDGPVKLGCHLARFRLRSYNVVSSSPPFPGEGPGLAPIFIARCQMTPSLTELRGPSRSAQTLPPHAERVRVARPEKISRRSSKATKAVALTSRDQSD